MKEKEGAMTQKLDKIFDSFMENTLFKDKRVLQVNYNPDTIPHRTDQIEAVASILAPSLRGDRVSNLFIYGKTGTGKTLSVQHVANEISRRTKQSNRDNLKIVYVNCKLKKVADTEYRILAEIISNLGGSVPITGLPTDAVYNKFIEMIDNKRQMILLILDEVDQAVKKISDSFLYTLTRLNSD
ncbi:AAA family ATPase, partial [Candidatus Pacearchaeota archaeon]|nr:AAA family ATPase [Candidatus Pacearchaeota archaeon]